MMVRSKVFVFAVILVVVFVSSANSTHPKGHRGKRGPKKVIKKDPKKHKSSYSEAIVRDIEQDNQVVCKAMKDDPKKRLSLHAPAGEFVRYEDILRQLTLTYRFNLGFGKTKLPTHKTRREILDLITSIFSIGCPDKYVPTTFVNTVRELATLYLNELKDPSASFAKFIPDLQRCKNETTALKFTGNGFEMIGVQTAVDETPKFPWSRRHGDTLTILPHHELMDELDFPDKIIDSVWWFFSFTFGRCYPYYSGDKAVTMSNFKRAFYEIMLEGLTYRWMNGPELPNPYGPIFGNIPLARTFANLRYCSTAGYLFNRIGDRELVRPISFAGENSPHHLYLSRLNKKTGQVWRPRYNEM